MTTCIDLDKFLEADSLADTLAGFQDIKGVVIFTEEELLEVINTLRAAHNEIDSLINGVA